MWKVCISEQDAVAISDYLNFYAKLLPVCDDSRKAVLDLKSRLDELIVTVQVENKLVSDYLQDIKSKI